MITPEKVRKVVVFMKARAAKLRDDAGHSGSMTDGGAHALEEQIAVWQAGLQGKLPQAWWAALEELERQEDPEYAEYLRLKKKFESQS